MASLLLMLRVLCFAAASELNLNEIALTLQESLTKATDTSSAVPGVASSEQLQRVTDLLLSLMPQSQSPSIEFDPPLLLDFGELAVAVPVSRQLNLVNRSSSVVQISSILLFDDKHFELDLAPKEIVLAPQESFDLKVAFFPNSIGLVVNLLLLNTNVGRIQYFIRAETTFNPYKLEPVTYDSLLLDSAFSHRLFIYNPHTEPIDIKSVATTNDHFRANFTDEDYSSWMVQPGRMQQIAILQLTTRVPGYYAGQIVIDTNFGKLVVSVNLQVLKSALRLEQASVKLGVLTHAAASFNFDLFVTNIGKKSVAVNEIKPVRSSATVKFKQTNQVVKSRHRTSLGTVTVTPIRSGVLTGSVLIYTNETAEPLEVRYRGEMDPDLLHYDKDMLSFYPGNENPRTVDFLNPKLSSLLIFNVSTTSPELVLSPSISHTIGPKDTGHLTVSYSGSFEVPKTLYIILHSSFEELLIPVTIHNDLLECNVNSVPCGKVLDLGSVIFEGTKVYASPIILELVNSSLLDKTVKRIDAPKGIKVKVGNKVAPLNLKIPSEGSVFIEVIYESNIQLTKRSPVLSIVTDRRTYTYDIVYTAIKGSLKFNPLAFMLKSPSLSHSLVLQVTNRFPVPVTIKTVDYDSKVIDVMLIKTVIKPNTTIDLAKVTFGFNELKFKKRLSSFGLLTFEDFSIYKELEANWAALSSKLFNIRFTTNQPFNLDVPATVSVMRTALTFAKRLDFGNIFVDSLNEKYLELKNNLDQPVAYKLYLGPDSIKIPNRAHNCKNGVAPGFDDDEFEVSPQMRTEACRNYLQEEVLTIKAMSSLKAPAPRREMSNWNLYGKVSALIGDLLYFSQPLVYYNFGESFFINGDEGIIDPKQSVIVGPLSFMPNQVGAHNSTLYVKNNHTFIEEVRLIGRAESSSLFISTPDSVSENSLVFAVSVKDVLGQLTTSFFKKNSKDLTFAFNIDLKNTGKLGITIKNILLNGHSCSAFGISLSNCFENTPLGVGQIITTKLLYTPDFQQQVTKITLLVVTDRGLTEARVEFKVDEAVLNEFNFKTYRRYRWSRLELMQTEVVVLFGLILGYGIFVYLLVEDYRLSSLLNEKKLKEANDFKETILAKEIQEANEADELIAKKLTEAIEYIEAKELADEFKKLRVLKVLNEANSLSIEVVEKALMADQKIASVEKTTTKVLESPIETALQIDKELVLGAERKRSEVDKAPKPAQVNRTPKVERPTTQIVHKKGTKHTPKKAVNTEETKSDSSTTDLTMKPNPIVEVQTLEFAELPAYEGGEFTDLQASIKPDNLEPVIEAPLIQPSVESVQVDVPVSPLSPGETVLQISDDSVRSDNYSKHSNASTCYKAGSQTPPSEEEISEDIFLDVYKFNVLFSGPLGAISSLAELRDN